MPPEYAGSVYELIQQRPELANRPISEVVNIITPWGKKVISILPSEQRTMLGSDYGGGSLFQTYTWTERYDPCLAGHTPQEISSLLLDVEVWNNWRNDTKNPGPPFPWGGP